MSSNETMDDGRHVLPNANIDGPALLSEQTQLLSESTPSDISFLYFLKLRLGAQQRATAQRNYWQRLRQEVEGGFTGAATGAGAGRSATASSTLSNAIPVVDADAYPAASSWEVQTTPVRPAQAAGGGTTNSKSDNSRHSSERNSNEHAMALHGARSPPEDSSLYSGSVVSRFEASSSIPQKHQQQQQNQPSSSAATHTTPFEDLPASAAKRSMASESPALPSSQTSQRLEGRAASLDETPAVASGTPQMPAGVEEVEDVPLLPCPHCGRTFAPNRLERHAVTCARQQLTNLKSKADSKERKTSSSSSSVVGSYIRPDRAAPTAGSASATSGAAKTEKWRRQSAQLRSALAGTPVVEDDRVQCPYCGRRFAEAAAARHIPVCKAKEERHP